MKACVLSGGGAKGAFQVGVLRYLVDKENRDYDVYTGISVGALNAAQCATGPLPKSLLKLEHIWLNSIKGNSSIWKHHLFIYLGLSLALIVALLSGGLVALFLKAAVWITAILFILSVLSLAVPFLALIHTKSVYKNSPLRKIIDNELNLTDIMNSGKILRVGAVQYQNGTYMFGTHENTNLKKWIMASSSFPIFFPMERIGPADYTDGGVVEVAPLDDALALGADEIDIILASPLESDSVDKVPGLPMQLMRILDLMSGEIKENDLIKMGHANGKVKIRLFMPDKELTSNSLDFNPKKLEEMYLKGMKAGGDPIYK